MPSTLQKVAALAVPQFADWCAVDMLDSDGSLRRLAVAHTDPAKVELCGNCTCATPQTQRHLGAYGLFCVPANPKSLLRCRISCYRKQPGTRSCWRNFLRSLDLRSYMGVALNAGGKTVGVLTFIVGESGRRFGPNDLRLAEDLANRAAIAIENARLYSELQEADRRKDEFLATLAHELRNPPSPIHNTLQIMKLSSADAETVELCAS